MSDAIICDRCRKVTVIPRGEDVPRERLARYIPAGWQGSLGPLFQQIWDLCPDCLTALDLWITPGDRS